MRLFVLKLGTALSALALTSAAYAETDDQGVNEDGILVLGRIEANGLRDLRDVPKPVSLVSEADLKVFDLTSLSDALSRLSNVRWNDGNPRTGGFSLRGLTSGAGSDKIDPSIGVVVDGVPYAYLPLASQADVIDVEQVNVTRGPQGTLGARHTSVGQINIITRRPSFTPDASASLTLGENNTVRAVVQGGGPVIDGLLAFRITAQRNQQDGHWWNRYPSVAGRQSHTNTDRTYGRAQLLFTPSQDLNIRLLYDHQPNGAEYVNGLTFRKDTPNVYANGAPVNKTNDAYAKLGRRWFTQQTSYTPDDYYTVSGGLYLDNNNAVLTGGSGGLIDIDYSLGNHTVSLLSSFRKFFFQASNDDGTPFDISFHGGLSGDYWQHSHEAKLTGSLGDGLVDYTVGAFYLLGKHDYFFRTLQGSDSGAWNANVAEYAALDANSSGRELATNSLVGVYRGTQTNIRNESTAAFAHADWHLSQPLTLTTGFRISREKRELLEGAIIADQGNGAALNPVSAGAVQFGGFNSAAFNAANPGSLLAGNTATQLSLADAVALQYFGVAATATPGDAYNSLTAAQRRQVAAAKSIRNRHFGTLWDLTEADPWKGNVYTGQVSLRNEFSSNLTGYATVQYGEKPGASQFGSGLLPDGSGRPRNLKTKKERTTGFELGVRSSWLDGDLLLNANVFRADIKDFQQNVFFYDELLTNLNNDGTLYYTSGAGNVEKVRSQGVEVDFVYNGIRHLSLRFSGAYTDAKYIDHQFSGQPTENSNLTDRFRDVSGFTLNNAPKVQFNATANYRRPVSDRFDVHGAISYSYTGKENGDAALSSYAWNKAYGIVDLSVGVGRQDGLFDLSFIARNLLNEDRGDAGWSSYTIHRNPRWLGVMVSSRFL